MQFLRCSLLTVDVEQILIILIVYVLKTRRYLSIAFQRFLSRYRKKMERQMGAFFTAFLIRRLKGSYSPYTTILDVIVITSVIITIWINAYKVGYKCSGQKNLCVLQRGLILFPILILLLFLHFLRLIYLTTTNLVFQFCENNPLPVECMW